jgi:hypothetical protein
VLGVRLLEGCVARTAGIRLWPIGCEHFHSSDVNRVEPESTCLLSCRQGHLGRAGLQTVVDDDGTGPQPAARRFKSGSRGQSKGIGPTAEGNQNQFAITNGGSQQLAHRTPNIGHGRRESGAFGHHEVT